MFSGGGGRVRRKRKLNARQFLIKQGLFSMLSEVPLIEKNNVLQCINTNRRE